jgi:hypothetical protein
MRINTFILLYHIITVTRSLIANLPNDEKSLLGRFFYEVLLPSLLPNLIDSIVDSWFIEEDKLSILLSILIKRYAATAMGKPVFEMAFIKSSMVSPPFLHVIYGNKYAVENVINGKIVIGF